MRRPGSRRITRRALILSSTALLALLIVQSALAMPTGITEEAEQVYDLFLFVTALAVVVFVIVTGALAVALFRFRKRNDELPNQTHGSTILEMFWVAIPVLIVVLLFTYSSIVLIDIEDDAADEDLTVEVLGFQFQWQFTYNLNDLGTNTDRNAEGTIQIIGSRDNEPRLVIPVGEPVEFRLVANDVIHSFYIPEFLYKLDVIPGRDNAFKVTAKEIGVFEGQCAELCGVDHALMRFSIEVVSREDFDNWVAEQSGSAVAARQP